MPNWIALDISFKNIFNNYYFALKRFSLHDLPIPQYFLHPSKKLLPAIGISLHLAEKQSMYHLKSLKEKTLSSCVNGYY